MFSREGTIPLGYRCIPDIIPNFIENMYQILSTNLLSRLLIVHFYEVFE